MEWHEHTISTSVDRLLAYLDEHGEASVHEIAKDLDVSEDQVEAWVDALGESDMIEKDYSAREGALISLSSDEAVEEEAEAVSSETGEQMESLSENIDHIEELDAVTDTLKELSETFQKELKAQQEVEKLLNEIEEEEHDIETDLETLQGEERELEEQALGTLEAIEMQIKDEQPESLTESFKDDKDVIEQKLETLQGLKDHIEEIEAEKQQMAECDICGKTFETDHGLRTHRGMKHPDATPEKDAPGLIGRIKGLFS